MSDPRSTSRNSESLKSNVLPFPALTHAPPDPPKPSLLKSLVALVVLVLAISSICAIGCALITL